MTASFLKECDNEDSAKLNLKWGHHSVLLVVLQNAIAKLIRGNELELAVSLSRIVPKAEDLLEISTLLLVKRCEKFGRW